MKAGLACLTRQPSKQDLVYAIVFQTSITVHLYEQVS